MKLNIRLLNGSYRRNERSVTVELFGRTDGGVPVTVLFDGFQPYFHLVEPPEDVRSELAGDPEARTEEVELWLDGVPRRCLKVVVTFPWTVPDYRRRFERRCRVLAADIPFYQRFMYDMDIGGCAAVEGTEVKDERRDLYTTGLVVQAERFLDAAPFKPLLTVLSFDIENSIEPVLHEGRILVVGYAFKAGNGTVESGHLVDDDEGTLIRKFIELVERCDPDVITGYNIEGYDIPFLAERARRHGIVLALGRDRSEVKERADYYQSAKGRVVVDAWKAVKRELRPKKETLNHVSRVLLGETKLDLDPRRMNEYWLEDRQRVIDYCLKDAVLPLRIVDRLNVLDKGMDLSTVSKVVLDDVINGRTSTLIDSILIRRADREGIGVPLTRRTSEESRIEGGYVHSIKAGLYRWVCVLDFKSMYPSVIIGNNICFTTMSREGTTVSPIGVRFLTRDVREGLLPRILADLMGQRDAFKRLRNEAVDDDIKRYYDGLQEAVKILMNSFYGVFASTFYRFTDQQIGASITSFARENIKGIIGSLESEGSDVVYSDTDSIFVLSPRQEIEAAIEFGRSISRRYSKGSIVLEFEKVLDPMFSHGAKKRYVALVVWPKEEMLVRGYETRRTDAFDLQIDALNDVFRLLLEGQTDETVHRAKEIVRSVRSGDVEPERLVISRTCKVFERYKNPERLPWVQAARKMQQRGYEFVPGMKVSWVVTNSRASPQRVEPFIDGVEFEPEPDYGYYAERIATSLARLTEAFGWDAAALLDGQQQKTLAAFQEDLEEAEDYDAVPDSPNGEEADGEGREPPIRDFDRPSSGKKPPPVRLDEFL